MARRKTTQAAKEAEVQPEVQETEIVLEPDAELEAALSEEAQEPAAPAASVSDEQGDVTQATPAVDEGVPDHFAPKMSLDDYAGFRALTPFQLGALKRSAGSYDRTFDDWEKTRQSLLGG